jgi:hypothetical protein
MLKLCRKLEIILLKISLHRRPVAQVILNLNSLFLSRDERFCAANAFARRIVLRDKYVCRRDLNLCGVEINALSNRRKPVQHQTELGWETSSHPPFDGKLFRSSRETINRKHSQFFVSNFLPYLHHSTNSEESTSQAKIGFPKIIPQENKF